MRVDLLLVAFLAVIAAHGEVVTWTNTAGGNWSAAANWSPNHVPGVKDMAMITNAGTYSVTVDTSPSIVGLVIGGDSGVQTVSLASNVRLTGNGASQIRPNGRLNLSGSDVRGSNTVDVAGVLTWTSGALNPDTAIHISSQGQLILAGGAAKALQGTLTNSGLVRWTGSGDLVLASVLHNLDDGLFELANDQSFQWAIGGSPVFINDGVLRKSSGSGTTICRLPLINNGRVETETGALAFTGGSLFRSGCVFAGAGTNLMVLSAGVITLDGVIQSENLTLQGARLMGTNTLLGSLTWVSGEIGANAVMTIATNSQLILTGTAGKSLQGVLTNAGTVQWTGTSDCALAQVVHNLPGALFEVQNDQRLLVAIGGSPTFINDGVFRKSAGTATTTCWVPFVNNGRVDTRSGTVIFLGGSAFNSGCVFSGTGTNLLPSGVITVNGDVNSENLVLQGATLSGTGSFSGSLKWLSGTMGAELAFTIPPTGHLILEGPDLKRLNSTVTNAGTITWAGTGDIAAYGVIHNLAGGLFEVRNDRSLLVGIGGTPEFINEGDFRKTAGNGTNTCLFPFMNKGTVSIESGGLYFNRTYQHALGTIALAGGAFRTFEPLILEGGRLTGVGTVLADVTSAATVAPASLNGTLHIAGNYTQLLTGSLEFELAAGAPVTVPGLSIMGRAQLNGSLGVHLVDGVIPSPGTEFPIMSFASASGDFCCFNGLTFLGQGRRLVTTYGTNKLSLIAQDAPEPAGIPLRIAVDHAVLVCWPWEFLGYALFSSTNFNQPTWTLIFGATNRWIESAPLGAQKYFQLVKP